LKTLPLKVPKNVKFHFKNVGSLVCSIGGAQSPPKKQASTCESLQPAAAAIYPQQNKYFTIF
jgi:hypothetical protein